eukprot:TRINITY_DN47163_c0_g1_i1.p1 TRINITY_DN47163_c0_g1~~TRINITY_DN47163_c0_g1_i1.p1  ORF type:complete len:195 (+),score=28.27 TRINITY_DN47163_c0_g1_i1:101-685(+)
MFVIKVAGAGEFRRIEVQGRQLTQSAVVGAVNRAFPGALQAPGVVATFLDERCAAKDLDKATAAELMKAVSWRAPAGAGQEPRGTLRVELLPYSLPASVLELPRADLLPLDLPETTELFTLGTPRSSLPDLEESDSLHLQPGAGGTSSADCSLSERVAVLFHTSPLIARLVAGSVLLSAQNSRRLGCFEGISGH